MTEHTPAKSTPPPPEADLRFSVDLMDRTADPAADFYRYASGTWLDRNPVPADQVRWGVFAQLAEQNFARLRTILQGAADDPASPRPSPRHQVGDLFVSALDRAHRDQLGKRPIEPDLQRIAQVQDASGIVAELARLQDHAVFPGFYTFVAADRKASGTYAFYLHQGGLSLPDRDYYLKPEFEQLRDQFVTHMVDCWRLLGLSADDARARAATVFALEMELARASRSRADLRDAEKNYHRVEAGDLDRRWPAFGWPAYLRSRGIPGLAYAIVGQPEFLDAFTALLQARPVEEWRAYLGWNLVRDEASSLDSALDTAHFDFFERKLRGKQAPEPDWRRAATVVDQALGEALGSLYVERYFPPAARARMMELVDDLREVFRDRLARLEWMTEATRQRALAKFQRFTVKIGHPDVFRDYSSVRIDRADYLGNLRRAAAFEIRRDLDRIGGPVDPTEWGMTPPTVNAYFNATQNEIVFPAGILQPPFFDATADAAVNYGAIGAVIGHEITHGYDDQGRKFDAEGNLSDWWTTEDAEAFQARARTVIARYNAYEILPGVHVNGELTLGENIADLGGIAIAYEALQRRLAKDPASRRSIEGWTPDQRFFLAFAQMWRSNSQPEELRRRIAIDPHSPGPFRVRGALTDMAPFATAFGIREGSPYYPTADQRVRIW